MRHGNKNRCTATLYASCDQAHSSACLSSTPLPLIPEMVCSSGGTQHPTTPHSSLVQIMTFKSALTVASIALIATASSLAMAAPSEAKDGCGRRFKFSNYHGQCILKNKFRGNHQAPVVIRPVFVRPAIRRVIRPAVRPLIQPVVLHPYAQPSTLHPYPQTAPNPYTQVIHNHNNPTIQTVNPYPQTFAQPSIYNPYTQVAY